MELRGKRALVTGSSAGIGAGIARMLAGEGVAVVVHGRDQARADQVAEGIRAAGGHAATAIGDLENDDEATSVAQRKRYTKRPQRANMATQDTRWSNAKLCQSSAISMCGR